MNDEVRAVQHTRTRTRLPAHAHAHTACVRTLAARPSRQSILGEIIPADFVQRETSGDAYYS